MHTPHAHKQFCGTRACKRYHGVGQRTLDHSPPSSPGFPRALSPTACDRAFSVSLRNHILRPSACQHRGCPVSREASHNKTQGLGRRSITSVSSSPSTRLGCAGRAGHQAERGGGWEGRWSVVDRPSPTGQQHSASADANKAARPLWPTDSRKGCAHTSTMNNAGSSVCECRPFSTPGLTSQTCSWVLLPPSATSCNCCPTQAWLSWLLCSRDKALA